ncbi:hypothetical protein ACIHDR_09145 [Nocardia sp. NPDC052278]|uniref:hypothetical protein n=1 Tax=unclassified Nocardia TaxID=2637762 RepID=UPI0036CCEE44
MTADHPLQIGEFLFGQHRLGRAEPTQESQFFEALHIREQCRDFAAEQCGLGRRIGGEYLPQHQQPGMCLQFVRPLAELDVDDALEFTDAATCDQFVDQSRRIAGSGP